MMRPSVAQHLVLSCLLAACAAGSPSSEESATPGTSVTAGVGGSVTSNAASVASASEAASTSGAGGASQNVGVGGGAAELVTSSQWSEGPLPSPLPAKGTLLPLPGGGIGEPVFTSNNPEVFKGNGLLYGTGHPSPTRGGKSFPMSGDFGVYLHHLNQSGATKVATLMVTNPNAAAVTVSAEGSGYNQTETGGLALNSSPDFFVSKEWITGTPSMLVPPTNLPPMKPLAIWQKQVKNNAEIDGRFVVHASGPVFAYLVVTDSTDLNQAIAVYKTDAPGIIAKSGNPPPPFGREAGVYAHDTWRGVIRAEVPPAGHHVGFAVNTATGLGFPQVQAFKALTHYSDSAAEAVGMYGNVYDLDVELAHDGEGSMPRKVGVVFASLVTADISRYWDGVGLVDGKEVILTHTPKSATTLLKEVTLAPGEKQVVRFQAMVPGLASIPQALFLVSY
ncbi:MAG: DUF3370 family protein [Deltaproteobacteria bacterium]|nr:DUF3370 family protein [Deltaproteobacteria bacterium]